MMVNTKFYKKFMTIVTIMLGLFLLNVVAANAQLKHHLFNKANQAKDEALTLSADILAPYNFQKALDYYKEAEEKFQKQESLDEIRKHAKAAEVYFRKAAKATNLATVALNAPIAAYRDALEAEAPTFAPELWNNGKEKLLEAAEELEKDGDVNDAKAKGQEASELLRKAELEAIESNLLGETRKLLKKAEEMDVEERAPQTLKTARNLTMNAEKKLAEDRYDTDEARNLAIWAKYEAEHAIAIATLVQKIEETDANTENVILMAEQPLARIAETIDARVAFDKGFKETADEVVRKIKKQNLKIKYLDNDLSFAESLNDAQEQRIAELEKKLMGEKSYATALSERVEDLAVTREKYNKIENMFTPGEANVFRQGEDVIIRLYGLTFPVGKSTIEPKYYDLLAKVQRALEMFPTLNVIIEGHTDSFGSDEANFKLSQERAEAVKQYFVANMGLINPTKLLPYGFGETKPIANNETENGRALNRRIDIVLEAKNFEGTN